MTSSSKKERKKERLQKGKAAKEEKGARKEGQERKNETKERETVHSDTQLMSPGAAGRLMIVKPACTVKRNALKITDEIFLVITKTAVLLCSK
jgi:hypothetical protein